ncbi:MAG: GDSL-type esterase/lipase family protein [bacterium]|nr:GDSL-type esterase/lipase family protein [bacterium]
MNKIFILVLSTAVLLGCMRMVRQKPAISEPPLPTEEEIVVDTLSAPTPLEDTLMNLFVRQYRQELQKQIDSIKERVSLYSHLNFSENSIQYSNVLIPLFQRFKQHKYKPSQLIEIIHIGDSHIQSRLMTHPIRDGLQKIYGNAGPGYFFGFVVEKKKRKRSRSKSKTLQPQFQARAPLTQQLEIIGPPVGLAGFAAQPKRSTFDLEIPESLQLLDSSTTIQLTLFCDVNRFSFQAISLWNHSTPSVPFTTTIEPNALWKETILTPKYRLGSHLRMVRKDTAQPIPRWYGWSFQTADRGLLYHTIGMNGASYFTYNQNILFWEQIQSFQPQLIIISLGTNDGYGSPLQLDKWINEVNQMVSSLRRIHPQAQILLTSPADAARGKGKRKKGIEQYAAMSHELKRYCNDNRLAFWDFYRVMGGSGSIKQWVQLGLAKPDYVHFTPEGYQLQANLFLMAFFQAMVEHLE